MNQPAQFSEIPVSVKAILQAYLETWLQSRIQLRQDKNLEMQQLLVKVLNPDSQQGTDRTYLPRLWECLQTFYSEVITWSQSGIFYQAESGDLISKWRETFQQAIKTYPRTIRIPIADNFWEPGPGDSHWVLLRKKMKRIRIGAAKTRLRFTNLFRKIPRQLPQTFRSFSFAQFVGHYAAYPFEQFLIEVETAYLQQSREWWDLVMQLTNQIGLALLFSKEQNRLFDQRDLQSIKQTVTSLLKENQPLKNWEQPMQVFQTEVEERFKQWVEEVFKQWQVNWDKAGSFSLPHKQFNRAKLQVKEQLLSKKFLLQQAKWEHFFTIEQEDWREEATLFILVYKTGKEYHKASSIIRKYVASRLLPSFTEAAETLAHSKNRFLSLDQDTTDREVVSYHTFQSESSHLLQELKNRVLPAMMKPLINKAPKTSLSMYLRAIQEAVKQLPERAKVIGSRDLASVPPKSGQEEIQMRGLFEKHLLIAFQEGLAKTGDNLVETLESVLINISEIEQIVSFNLETAQTSLQEKNADQQAGQMTAEGLGRALEKVTNLVATINTAEESAQAEIHSLTFNFLFEAQNLINNEKFIELSFRLARAQMRERLKTLHRRVAAYSRKTAQLIIRQGTKGFQIINTRFKNLKTALGFTTISEVTDKKLQQFLIETSQTIESLPYIYQQLFRMEPLREELFFIQRESELSRLREDFRLWQKGQFMVAAVIGERGSGKTTLMNLSEKLVFSGYPLKWVKLEQTVLDEKGLLALFMSSFSDLQANDLDELKQYLMKLNKPVVCVVKSLHFLFLKTIEGFDLLEKFLLLISKTTRNVYWVVTCNRYSWELFDKVIGIVQYFPGAITLSGMNTGEIEEVIMQRHKVTGFKLHFETPEKLKSNRKFKKLNSEAEQQTYLNNSFFQQLQDTADGNLSVAILFWLKAIRNFETSHLILSPEIDTDFAYLNQLSQEELFTLGALIQHEILTSTQHALIFLQNEAKSQLQLNTLSNKGILFEVTEGAFKVNLSVYRPLVRLLKRNRILP